MRCNRHYLSFIRGAFSSPYLNTQSSTCSTPPHFILTEEREVFPPEQKQALLFCFSLNGNCWSIWTSQAKNPQSGKVFFYSLFLCMQPFFSRLMQVLFIGEVCLLSSSILEVIKNGSQSCSVKAMQGSSWCALFCKKHTCLKSQNKQIDWGVESDFLDNLAQYCC